MELSSKQLAKLDELVKQGEAYEQLRNSLPENITSAWSRFVGQMREYFYMDEQWDGKELLFIPSIKAVLETDKITVSVIEDDTKWVISSPEEADGVIQTLIAKQLPERKISTDNMKLSAGNGRCDMCLYNSENSKKRGSIVDLATGFAMAYGHIVTSAPCDGGGTDCEIIDIGHAIPGLTAQQITDILFPYWWSKSRFNKKEA